MESPQSDTVRITNEPLAAMASSSSRVKRLERISRMRLCSSGGATTAILLWACLLDFGTSETSYISESRVSTPATSQLAGLIHQSMSSSGVHSAGSTTGLSASRSSKEPTSWNLWASAHLGT